MRDFLATMIQAAKLIARTIPRFDEHFLPPRGSSDVAELDIIIANTLPEEEALRII